MSDTSILTRSGKLFDFLNPDTKTICIEDIAHALALENRYSGQIPYPYSVAQHSYLMASVAPAELKVHCLLHDSAEAYMRDVAFPQKHCTFIQQIRGGRTKVLPFKGAEEQVLRAIYEALKVDWPGPDVWANVKVLDRRILATEIQAFWPEDKWSYFDVYTKRLAPLDVYIHERQWRDAEFSFMAWWRTCRG